MKKLRGKYTPAKNGQKIGSQRVSGLLHAHFKPASSPPNIKIARPFFFLAQPHKIQAKQAKIVGSPDLT